MTLAVTTRPDSTEPQFAFGNFKLNSDGSLLRGETWIHVPPKELAALRYLLSHAGQVVTATQLRQALWGDIHVSPDSAPRCLSSLRALLEPEQCIQTVYKRGYRLVGPVRSLGLPDRCPMRLAIMPFATGHDVQEHLGPAIAEEVTTRLTAMAFPSISVLARDSSFTLASRGLTAVQVGKTLDADFVLAGTLLAMITLYRLRVEMIRVHDGTQIWVEDMLIPREQILKVESELLQRLLIRLGTDSSAASNSAESLDPHLEHPDAYAIFLQAHHEWQTLERHRMQDGMQHLLQATELDPALVAAHVDLANVCLTQEFYGFLSPDIAANRIRQIGDSISNIPENAPQLLPALGWLHFHFDHNLPKAMELFSASAQLPHDSLTTRMRLMFALSRQSFDEAEDWLQSALLIDPYAPWLHAGLAWTWHLAGLRAKSETQIEKALSLFPDHECPLFFGALILAFNDQPARAEVFAQALVRRAPYCDIASAIHAYTLACAGRRDEAFDVLERLQWLSRERFVLRSFTAGAYTALGDLESAISELSAAASDNCPWFFQTLADPRLEPLHSNARFQSMRATLEQMEFSTADALECRQ